VARAKLPKWAIKKAGGINKKAWRLARAGRKRSSPSRRKARASPKRRSTMSRRRKTFSIPLVQSVAGLAIANIATKGITSSKFVENPIGSLTTAGNNLLGNKDTVIKLGLGSLVAQFVATEVLRKRTIGSIGPIKLKA